MDESPNLPLVLCGLGCARARWERSSTQPGTHVNARRSTFPEGRNTRDRTAPQIVGAQDASRCRRKSRIARARACGRGFGPSARRLCRRGGRSEVRSRFGVIVRSLIYIPNLILVPIWGRPHAAHLLLTRRPCAAPAPFIRHPSGRRVCGTWAVCGRRVSCTCAAQGRHVGGT